MKTSKQNSYSPAISPANLKVPSSTSLPAPNNPSPDFGAAALYYSRAGFTIIPCYPKSKIPAVTHAEWLSDYSEAAIISYWTQHPNHELALIPGDNIVSLDADSPEGIKALDRLEAESGVKSNFVVNTVKGQHRHYRIAKGVYARSSNDSTQDHPDRIDVKTGNSPIMLPPSTGKSIVVNNARSAAELTEVGQDFIDAVAKHNHREPPRPYIEEEDNSHLKGINTPSTAEIERALKHVTSDCGYEEWLKPFMALHNHFHGSEEGFDLARTWSEPASNYCGEEELRKKWQSFSRNNSGRRITIATLFDMARKNGATDLTLAFDIVETEVVYPKPQTVTRDQPTKTEADTSFRRFSMNGMSEELEAQSVGEKFILQDIALMGQWTVIYAKHNTGKTLIVLRLLTEGISNGDIVVA